MKINRIKAWIPFPFWAKGLIQFIVGIGMGLLFHYVLYRISLPIQPFIYVAF